MNGSAPNFEKTGSQTLVQRKLQPKACRDAADCTNSSTAIAPVMASTDSANPSAVNRKAVSARRQRGAGRRDRVRGTTVSRVMGGGCGRATAGVAGESRGKAIARRPAFAIEEAGM